MVCAQARTEVEYNVTPSLTIRGLEVVRGKRTVLRGIDPALPRERIEYMLGDAACTVALVDAAGRAATADVVGTRVVFIDVAALEPIYPQGNDHCGMGVLADLGDTVQRLRSVVANLPAAKAAALAASDRFRQNWSWVAAGRKLAATIMHTVGRGTQPSFREAGPVGAST